MGRSFRLALLGSLLLAGGCGHTEEELIVPWCKYRQVSGPGGSGIWSGSTHTEVLVRSWWGGWSRVFDGNAAPGHPIALTSSVVLVPIPGSARLLRQSGGAMPIACGNPEAPVTVPPKGGSFDCVDHLGGPAPAIATSLRVRRLDPDGKLVTQYEFSAGDPGRVFLTPSLSFYDDDSTPYLVTFNDPWADPLGDGTSQRGQATPERLQQIACELIVVGSNPARVLSAPPGHKIADCSSAEMWGKVLGRPLRDPWNRSAR